MEFLGQRVNIFEIQIDTMKMPSKKVVPAARIWEGLFVIFANLVVNMV